MRYDGKSFERRFHLRPFSLPGGDAATKAPRRVADSLLHQLGEVSSATQLIESGINCPISSSMGRLFDAVSFLLGVCERPTYDGEAAMRLEAVADKNECGDLAFEIRNGQIDWRPLLRDLLVARDEGIAVPILAARFHNTVAEIVYCCGKHMVEKHSVLPWVFAGGVFQNRLLVERIQKVVGNEYELVFSGIPNDSGMALGQAAIGARLWASR